MNSNSFVPVSLPQSLFVPIFVSVEVGIGSMFVPQNSKENEEKTQCGNVPNEFIRVSQRGPTPRYR